MHYLFQCRILQRQRAFVVELFFARVASSSACGASKGEAQCCARHAYLEKNAYSFDASAVTLANTCCGSCNIGKCDI